MDAKKRSPILLALGQGLYAAILCGISFLQLQHSCSPEPLLAELAWRYLVLSLMVLGGVYLLLSIPWRYAATGGVLFSVVSTLLAIVNHYTLHLHGSLLTVQELSNFKTAMDVIGQYNFFAPTLVREVFLQLAILACCLGLSWIQFRFLERPSGHTGKKRRIGCLLCAVVVIGILCSGKVKPYLKKARSSWQPTCTVQYYGYPMVLAASMAKFELIPPAGYDADALNAIALPENRASKSEQPDIILILNESFYDLAQVMEFQTDEPYLSGIASLNNTLRGNAITQVGGGTNVTEFKLLTSNSQSLVGMTPFNGLNMADTSSIVSQLREQGYYTIASHPAGGSNYNRSNGYPAMGFDEIHFADDFENTTGYVERPFVTDASVYENVIHWYEAAQKRNQPIFSYCLTLQNHGGWDQNPPQADTVHLKDYVGTYPEEELNEYLTCIRMSDQAFVSLCDYFQSVDRPVIVCMVGDHSPSFINSVTTRDLGEETKIRQAAVPFVMWANFPLSETEVGNCSVTALGPMLLEQAGVKMTPFYRYVLELNAQFPVITDWGQCIGKDGTMLEFTEKSEQTEPIWNYLYLAYNNLLPESAQAWFTTNDMEDSA